MPLKTLQISILSGNDEAVFVGLRNFPAHKLILISLPEHAEQSRSLSARLTDTLKLPLATIEVRDSSVQAMLDVIGLIIKNERENFQDFMINVGSAGKRLACAGVTAAFVYGIKAFDVAGDHPEAFPVMAVLYTEALTTPKIEILRAIQASGGVVESLEALSGIVNYGKPLLSYHIRGSRESRGLESLGLVETERGKRGRLSVKLTPLARTLLATTSSN